MAATRTEEEHAEARGLDALPPDLILDRLARAQVEAARSVSPAIPDLAKAAEAAATALAAGGRLAYAAAGSSGLMAMADALELPGTFGIPRERIAILFAGGLDRLADFAGGAEDDAGQGAKDVSNAGIGAGDCLVAVSASGSTPYALGAAEAARKRGASVVAIANNEGAPLFREADIAVLLATPPEIIAGSTRMGAGTAQKIALNLFSTLAAIRLGHVHDGYMVDVQPDNAKLRDRARRMVAAIAGCGAGEAEHALAAAGGSVKAAVLLARGAPDAAAARGILERAGQRLRPALSMIEGSAGSGGKGAHAPQTGRTT